MRTSLDTAHESGLILGTQFHPERLTGPYCDDRTPNMAPYFAYFIQLVRNESEKEQKASNLQICNLR